MFSRGLVQKQHVGLQKVFALAGLAHSSLGPCKSYKMIREKGSGAAVLACSCVRLLETLELSCAVGQLVGEAVRAQHGAHGTGAGCLLFMAGAWSRAALECLQRGVPAPLLVRTMSEGLDVCLRACGRHSVRLELVNNSTPPPVPRSPAVATQRPDAHAHPGSIRLSHSRHFGGATAASAAVALASPASSNRDVGPAARALSHGRARSMDLVVQAGRLQSAPGACCSALDLGRLVTCVVPGLSEDQACVLPGWVVRLPLEKAVLAQRLGGRSLRVVLLTGDLCVRYRHLGSKSPPGLSHVADRLAPEGGGREARWADGVLAALLRLGVELVLVSGAASDALGPPCLARGVLLVEQVRPSVLRALARASGAVPVAYASQLSERCVGAGVTVTPSRELKEHQAVCVSARAPGGLATVVLTGCVPARLQALEDEFWACARRLQRALQDGALLPGAGIIEMLCVHDLQEHARRPLAGPGEAEPEAGAAGGLYRYTVLMLMAEALTDYVATVTANSGLISKLQARRVVEQEVERLGGVAGDGRSGVLQGEGALGETSLGGACGVLGGACCDLGGACGGLGGACGGLREASGGLGGASGGLGGTCGGLGGACEGLGGAFGGPGGVSGGAEQSRVYDNLSVKVEAWRSAMDLVLLVLQTDAEVITGVDPDSLRTETDLVLL
ncbi:Bardet-Biedl syndrome 12 protein [Gadus chalcogrammus]|uniref:Bardet-Biedl syndrome 12 protein n=1 Tax=Gadus chalcogrammus TaxID=1042646 RepID=UPI0024C4D576|nr:Bardet-Biedl syndrome 12 protein [Gadus chalcogrammus]